MTTATARSITLPRIRKALKPSSRLTFFSLTDEPSFAWTVREANCSTTQGGREARTVQSADSHGGGDGTSVRIGHRHGQPPRSAGAEQRRRRRPLHGQHHQSPGPRGRGRHLRHPRPTGHHPRVVAARIAHRDHIDPVSRPQQPYRLRIRDRTGAETSRTGARPARGGSSGGPALRRRCSGPWWPARRPPARAPAAAARRWRRSIRRSRSAPPPRTRRGRDGPTRDGAGTGAGTERGRGRSGHGTTWDQCGRAREHAQGIAQEARRNRARERESGRCDPAGLPHFPLFQQIPLSPVDSLRAVDNSVTRSVSSALPARQPHSPTAA